MKRQLPYMMAGSLIAAVLLAGCASNTNTAATGAGSTQTAQSQSGSNAAQPDGGAGAGQNRMNRAGMNFGKIKSIDGNTITIYTAAMPERQQNGSGQGKAPEGRGTASGDGTAAAPAEGQAAPADGQGAPAGEQGTPPEGGGQGGGRQGGGGGMMQSFSEETTDITVSGDTKYVSVTFENGQQKETALALTDLKADDIIQYTLKTDTTEAESITLSTGGFGGGMGGGRGQGQGGAPDGGAADGSTTGSK